MIKIQFPHITRKFTALVLLILLFFFNVLNLLQNQLFKTDEEKKLRAAIMQNPAISSLHERLGQYYLGADQQAAQREYKLAQEYSNVLGSESSPWQTWQNLVARKNNLGNELKYWENVTEIYPDYLYASLKLAILNWQKGDLGKAKNYLKTVLEKDPTDQNANKLSRIIK